MKLICVYFLLDVKHGVVSPRRFFHELTKVYDKFPSSKLSKPPVSLHGQLMWREYNNLMGYTTPNFDQTVGNPIARQIPWDDDPELLATWRDGRTGYPFIDAIMTQLKETGWIHHLARHAVACFLTRGDLWQSWEEGAAVFEERLIDADWSINNFNWQVSPCLSNVSFLLPFSIPLKSVFGHHSGSLALPISINTFDAIVPFPLERRPIPMEITYASGYHNSRTILKGLFMSHGKHRWRFRRIAA
jgi:FAD binding domain of DNA photolyase